MNIILKGLPGVDVVVDDILIYDSSLKEHNERLEAVRRRAQEVGLKLNSSKSQICKTEVPYVGHLITDKGLKPNPRSVQTIVDMPTPTDNQCS